MYERVCAPRAGTASAGHYKDAASTVHLAITAKLSHQRVIETVTQGLLSSLSQLTACHLLIYTIQVVNTARRKIPDVYVSSRPKAVNKEKGLLT
jgi:hypothetical protein